MMAKTNPSTIALKYTGMPHYENIPLAPLDASGNGAITPGMLVETINGEVRPHSTQAGNVVPIAFAVEGENIDTVSTTLGDIDVDYDDDNGSVKVWYPKSGDEVYALIGAGQSVLIDGLLQSASDGYLMGYTAAANIHKQIVGRAIAAVNNSAGSVPARVKVRVA
jgi:hypothetical protein